MLGEPLHELQLRAKWEQKVAKVGWTSDTVIWTRAGCMRWEVVQ